jgi:hypothetical protein
VTDWELLDGTVKFEPYPKKRPGGPGFDEVLGAILGVEEREGGNDDDGVLYPSKPPGNTTL